MGLPEEEGGRLPDAQSEKTAPAVGPRAVASSNESLSGASTASTDNVKVAVRARPLSGREIERGCSECVSMEGVSTTVLDDSGKKRTFAFDFSYWHDVSQQQVYEDLARPMVDAAIDGFNGVIFAYGQTGSGKTHSMMGSGDDVGIVPLMNRELFGLLHAKQAAEGGEFLVTASYMEIYNEVIRDLLNPSDKQLKIRENKEGIYVEHLAELVVEDAASIAELLAQGNQVKQVAATAMNERSSRSHCCFQVRIKQRKVEEVGSGETAAKRETTLSAKINLVDLAGSERASKTGAEGGRLKEGAAINQSLSALGNVINKLAEGSTGHVPYRNSKLTRVLQEALGGNARTVMIAALSPADYNCQETLSTLQYASRAKTITNKTKRNEDVNQRMIRELQEEVERLRAAMAKIEESGGSEGQMALAGNGGTGATSSTDVEKMHETIAMLEDSKKKQWDEVQQLSKAFEEERQRTLKNENVVRDIMQSVKEEKAEVLRRLHELELEKTMIAKSLKQTKLDYAGAKQGLEQDMAAYQACMALPEAKRDADAIAQLFTKIERNRDLLVEHRNAIKKMKERARANQEEQIQQRAEVEAQKVVLNEDASLRKAIQEEEKAKLEGRMEEMKDEYLATELEAEKSRLETHVHSQMQSVEAANRKRAAHAKQYQRTLEDKVAHMEIEAVDVRAEAKALRAKVCALSRQLDEERQQSKKNIASLVDAFKTDQGKLLKALQCATTDCALLYEHSL